MIWLNPFSISGPTKDSRAAASKWLARGPQAHTLPVSRGPTPYNRAGQPGTPGNTSPCYMVNRASLTIMMKRIDPHTRLTTKGCCWIITSITGAYRFTA